MLDITLFALLTIGGYARAAHPVVTTTAELSSPADFDDYLRARPERLDDWIGLQPLEFTRALPAFGADEASVAKITTALSIRQGVARKIHLLGLFRRAWADPAGLAAEFSPELTTAIHRYLLAEHGLPGRAFDTRADARTYVNDHVPDAGERAAIARTLVPHQGRWFLPFTYDIWTKLGPAARAQLTVPIWDQSTRVHLSVEMIPDATDDPTRAEESLASRLARPTGPGFVAVEPGQSLRLGDRLIYLDAAGTEIHASTFVTEDVVTPDLGRTFARRADDEAEHVHARGYRLTVRRPAPAAVIPPTKTVYFEDWLTPRGRPEGRFVDRCLKAFGF